MTIEQAGTTNLLYDNSTYHLSETLHTTRVIESFIGIESIVGEVRGWRRRLLSVIDTHFQEQDNRERGYRLYLAVKLLNELHSQGKACRYLELMKRLTLEEVIFWVWQYNSYGSRALIALKMMHIHDY